ncbi:uncharacterized protein LOC143220231 [Lasioglossum baleicum]|uniref:uncharacterized protein LOC143220231 n=1 Tax=Lasioglossum baleicum TaxID=434251 RepID=UPI003FCCA244
MIGCFIDLKAAFDRVNRGKLWEALEERGVSEGLRERIKEVYRETTARVRVGGETGEKFWYADDLVLLAKEESGMKLMIEEFRSYIREKGLEVNREKTKVVRFERRKQEKKTWRWGDGEVEEVEEIKYLGYIFKKNGGQEKQFQEKDVVLRCIGMASNSIWSRNMGMGGMEESRGYARKIC